MCLKTEEKEVFSIKYLVSSINALCACLILNTKYYSMSKQKQKEKKTSEKDERMKVLEATVDEIRGRFGDGSIMKLGEAEKVDVDAIPTGSIEPGQVLNPTSIGKCGDFARKIARSRANRGPADSTAVNTGKKCPSNRIRTVLSRRR